MTTKETRRNDTRGCETSRRDKEDVKTVIGSSVYRFPSREASGRQEQEARKERVEANDRTYVRQLGNKQRRESRDRTLRKIVI